jgi:hypothetical protein
MRRPVREVSVAPFGVRRAIARTPSSFRSKTQAGSLKGFAVSFAFIGSPFTVMARSVPLPRRGYARPMDDEPSAVEDPRETEEAEAEVDRDPGYSEGEKVWVQDADGNRHAGVFVGMNEAAGWFGGGPSAYVVHEKGDQAEVVSLMRVTPRD